MIPRAPSQFKRAEAFISPAHFAHDPVANDYDVFFSGLNFEVVSERDESKPWPVAQVVKEYGQKHVVAVKRHLLQGTSPQINALLQQMQGGGQINTAYIEQLNATFRSRIAALVRRGGALARQTITLHHVMYLMGSA